MNILNNVTRFKGEQSRTISPENPTGEKGKACMFDSKLGPGRKGRGSISLPQGKETVIAEISGTGIIKHMWMTIRENTEKGSFVLRDVTQVSDLNNEHNPLIQKESPCFYYHAASDFSSGFCKKLGNLLIKQSKKS
ncbi:hypothetical protein [Heyndrickxia coagulans]|uniref:hypothetical protein n=1 Tax=Heyndrickxia coagulans TaxID=1398 RepID=UPI0009C15B7E|nr:hypothetical protein [Heyndrickxia coagulans]